MLNTVNRNPSREELRRFGLVILVGLGVMGAVLWWLGTRDAAGLGWSGSKGQWVGVVFWAIGVAVPSVTLVSQGAGRAVYVVWMTVALWMGMVMIPLLLSVLFLVLLLPFTLIRFWDPLRLKLRREGSYWEKHSPHEASIERMHRPF